MAWAPLYATEDELRAYVRDLSTAAQEAVEAGTGDADNALIYTPALTAASREIDRSCGRQFGVTDDGEAEPEPLAETRTYTAQWLAERGAYVVSIDDTFDAVADVTVTVDAVEITTDGTLLPLNAPAKGRPSLYLVLPSGVGTATEGAITIEAIWGWPTVPDTIKNATLLQASRIVKRRDAPFGVAGSPDMGNELRLLAKLDPDVEVMVGAYRRYW